MRALFSRNHMAAVAALGTGAGLVYSSSGPAHRERQLHLNVNSHSLSKCNDTDDTQQQPSGNCLPNLGSNHEQRWPLTTTVRTSRTAFENDGEQFPPMTLRPLATSMSDSDKGKLFVNCITWATGLYVAYKVIGLVSEPVQDDSNALIPLFGKNPDSKFLQWMATIKKELNVYDFKSYNGQTWTDATYGGGDIFVASLKDGDLNNFIEIFFGLWGKCGKTMESGQYVLDAKALAECNIPALQNFASLADIDNDGEITFVEFVRAYALYTLALIKQPTDRNTINMDLIYQTLDLNNDGMISQKELSIFVRRLEVLGKLPAEYPTVASLMAAFDTNKDGSISKAEFMDMASYVDFSSVTSLDPSKA